jgi:hypothetical protein
MRSACSGTRDTLRPLSLSAHARIPDGRVGFGVRQWQSVGVKVVPEGACQSGWQ